MICPHCGKFIDDDRKKAYSGSGKTQDKKYHTMSFKIMRETEKAIGVEWFDETTWLPKSQLKSIDGGPVGGYDKNEIVEIQVSEWIAKEKGLIEEEPATDNPAAAAEKRLIDRMKQTDRPPEPDDIPF